MENKMTIAKLKEKGQITLPSNIREQLKVNKGDIFNIEVIKGSVVMTLQKLSPANEPTRDSKTDEILKNIGCLKGNFKDKNEIDNFINKERASWDAKKI